MSVCFYYKYLSWVVSDPTKYIYSVYLSVRMNAVISETIKARNLEFGI